MDSILLVHMVIELQQVFGVRFVHEDVLNALQYRPQLVANTLARGGLSYTRHRWE
jgi:hypothetical protein